jgi:hypothetical protein
VSVCEPSRYCPESHSLQEDCFVSVPKVPGGQSRLQKKKKKREKEKKVSSI